MEVTCDNILCGRAFTFRGGQSHFRRNRDHYCSRSCQNTTHGLDGTLRHRLWEQAKRRAKLKGIRFSITLAEMPDVPKVCPVLGVELVANSVAGPLDTSPSLDRKVAGKGYVPGNVRVISNRANRLRSDGTARELHLIADDAAQLEAEDA